MREWSPLNVDLDSLPLEELGYHHALGLVGGHTQRGLPVLIELVGILANRLQLVDHVGVPLRIILLLENCLYGRMEDYAEVFRFRRL